MKQSDIEQLQLDASDSLHSFAIGNMNWDSLKIYPARIGPEEAVGHFGWNLFEDRIIELNYEDQILIVHDELPSDLSEYTKLEIEYTHTLFCVKGRMSVNSQDFIGKFLFDTGFQRAVVLDRELTKKSDFPTDLAVIKETRLKNSQGQEFVNKVVEIDSLQLKQLSAPDVPVQMLSTPNPARFETHILGGELLKRFNTILDFRYGHVYLRANSLMSLPYQDKS